MKYTVLLSYTIFKGEETHNHLMSSNRHDTIQDALRECISRLNNNSHDTYRINWWEIFEVKQIVTVEEKSIGVCYL